MSERLSKSHKKRIERVKAAEAKRQAQLQALAEGIAKLDFCSDT